MSLIKRMVLPLALLLVASTASAQAIKNAVAVIVPVGDSKVTGVVRFTEADGKVTIVADIEGLTPGQHGFHIHEFGDATDPKGMGAGGHFNPEKHEHGKPTDPADKRHPGDMGNLTADDKGHAHLEVTLEGITLAGEKNAIVGRSVIVHEKVDDFSQPVGNAGARIGIGVIGVAKAPAPKA